VTYLLLTPHPLAFLGLRQLAETMAGGYGRHFFLFTGLSLLAFLGRWPISLTALACLLAAYGIGTEVLQALVPPRTPELADAIEDLLGIAAGLALGVAAVRPRLHNETDNGETDNGRSGP
jgi:hypothetical protein